MSLKDARDEIVRLKKLFPHQDFVIMGEVGEATKSERVTVKIDVPDLSEARPRKRKTREAPLPEQAPAEVPAAAPDAAQTWNVVPLRKEETG